MTDELQWFVIRYVADDGEIRRTEIQAVNEDEAEYEAYIQDMGNIGGDSISKIIDVYPGRL